MLSAVLLLASFLLFALPAFYFWTFIRPTSPLTLPPSPPGWPIIGNLLLFPRIFTEMQLPRFHQLYGPILTLWVGPVPFIAVSDAKIAREALVEKGALFASRPQPRSLGLFSSNFHNISSSACGSFWRTVRRNLVSEMLVPTKLKAFQPVREHVIGSLIDVFKAEAQTAHGGAVVEVYFHCKIAMFKLLLVMCVGIPLQHLKEDVVRQLAQVIDEILSHTNGLMGDFFPLLSFLDRKKEQLRRKIRQREVDVFLTLIEQHDELQKQGEIHPGNYLDTLSTVEREEGEKLTIDDRVSLCAEFLVGGTDTTVDCIEWSMAELVIHQDIQAKLHSEIQQVVNKRPIEEEDIDKMPYLQAVIKESLRIHPPSHLTLPHAATQQCKLAGYDIPSKATVFFDLPSISRDCEIWADAKEFKPERFLLQTMQVDLTGSRQMTMIPFGAGRRMCPGSELALMHASLFVGRLVQALEWASAKPGEKVDMSEKFEFTVMMKIPLRASITERP